MKYINVRFKRDRRQKIRFGVYAKGNETSCSGQGYSRPAKAVNGLVSTFDTLLKVIGEYPLTPFRREQLRNALRRKLLPMAGAQLTRRKLKAKK